MSVLRCEQQWFSDCVTEVEDQLFPEGGCFKMHTVVIDGKLVAAFTDEAVRDHYVEELKS